MSATSPTPTPATKPGAIATDDPQGGPVSFSFGENWSGFVASEYNEERVRLAREAMAAFLEKDSLEGLDFLDIGSGSGIHSQVAHQLGARTVRSFDVDPASVATTQEVRKRAGSPENWSVQFGSILDKDFVATVEPADIVYSWGVLHHTGKMWEAVRNAASLVRPGGLFFIALYTTDTKSAYWLDVKRRYNRAGKWGKKRIEAWHLFRDHVVPLLLARKNPIRWIREYKQKRGMNFFVDQRDWLGGYPYEHATPQEVVAFCRKQFGFSLLNIGTGEACSEYLFHSPKAPQA